MNKLNLNIKQLIGGFLTLIFVFTIGLSNIFSQTQTARGVILGNLKLEERKINSLIFETGILSKGQTITGSFEVTHDFEVDTKNVELFVNVIDFENTSSNTTPNYDFENTFILENAKLSSWLNFETPEFTLENRGDKITINFSLTIPENAEAGSKYATIFISRNAPLNSTERNQIGVDSNVGLHLFTTVEGDLSKNLDLNSFYTTDKNLNNKWLFFTTPIHLVTQFRASGNVHVEPRGKIFIHRDSSYANAIDSFDLNPSVSGMRLKILSNSSRTFTYEWENNGVFSNIFTPHVGRYFATIQYDFVNIDGKTTSLPIQTITFWIIPYWLIALIVIVCISIVYTYAKFKRNNSKQK